MRIKNTACIVSVLLASLTGIKASTTLTAWTFDNLSTGVNTSPSPATGFGSASALGLANSYNNTNSLSNPQVLSLAGSSAGGPLAWQVSGNGAAPNGGDGWSSSAPIGTQGAKFSGSTAGFYRVMATFDLYATPDAEANVQVQYTMEGTIWYNATNITSAGLAVVNSNANTNISTVVGTYLTLSSGWNNQITVDFSGISGADNNAKFAIRIVNATTGTNCVNTSGAAYNNVSGYWAFDNVAISGVSIDTITEWTFDSYGANSYVPNPIPEFSVGNASFAQALGFTTSFHFADGSQGSTNDPDVTSQAGSSTGNSGPYCWRVRGQGPGNGWDTQSPIGSQGGEFDVSTVNYNNIVVTFDLYFTTQAEAKMQVEYTTDGATWNNAPSLAYPANPTFIQTNSTSSLTYSPDTVTGTYFYETTGQNWYNGLVVDFTGVPGVAGNPLFGIRVVNAAQNGDCVAYNGGSYNNSSGNCRFDNVMVGGQFNGAVPPAVAYDPNATVDNRFTNTFTDLPNWRTNITAIYINGSVLTNIAYTTNTPGEIIFTPSNSPLLQVAGTLSIVYYATNYSSVKVTQPLGAGVAKSLATTIQPLAPSASGGTLAVNPVITISDQYGNNTTNPYANVTVTASVGGTGAWKLGGGTVQQATNGVATFTNLTATLNGTTALTGNYITFTVTGYGSTTSNLNSSTFSIGAPPVPFTAGNLAVLQVDTLSNNTTFSMIELKPSVAGQTTPVNIVPVSATGTNALRFSPAGSTGRLALSDDGTLLCFGAFVDGNAATPDETYNLNRAVGTMTSSNLVAQPLTYTSISLGGSQARAAATLDDVNFLADDKGGVYYGNGYVANPNVNSLNNVVVKTFGGVPYVETQKTANGSPIPVVYELEYDPLTDVYDTTIANNLLTDPVASDFYMVSTNGGTTYDILYIADQVNSSQGIIDKYSWESGAWVANGNFTNSTGIDGLFATTNGAGGVSLFYTTGAGGTGGNSVYRVTDSTAWGANINIVSSNLLYTASKTVSIKGLTFVPQGSAYPSQPIPPPVLIAQNGAKVSAAFSVTNMPDDPTWRSSITAITVNGTILPAAAYNVSQAGIITFTPAQSTLLQSSGSKTIVISATGYSTNSIAQVLISGPATQLLVTTQPKAPLGAGGPLATQPVVKLEDSYGNLVTNTLTVTAAPVQSSWTLGGTTAIGTTAGVATYTNLTAFSTNAVSGATISFTEGSLSATSSSFAIPAPIKSVLGNAKLSSGKLVFGFTNITGLSYSVLATNNISAPVSTWPLVGTTVESPAGSGSYHFTNSATTNGQSFYILRQP